VFSTSLRSLRPTVAFSFPLYFTTIFSGMLVAFAVYQSRLTKQYYFSASALRDLHSLIRSPYCCGEIRRPAIYAARGLPRIARKTSRRWTDGATVAQYLTVGLLVIYTRSPTVGPGDTAINITSHNHKRIYEPVPSDP